MYDERADLNGDGCINILDLSMAGGNLGRSCPKLWTGARATGHGRMSSTQGALEPDGSVVMI